MGIMALEQSSVTGSVTLSGKLTDHRPILEALTRKIWDRAPVLADIMQTRGGRTLFDYARDFIDVNPTPALQARKEELIAMTEELVAGRLGAETGSAVAKQLRAFPLVSTADHHAPIDNAYWINSDIITALPYVLPEAAGLTHLIVFSFSSVSLNNSSGYPRGIEFHADTNGSASYTRLPFLQDKLKMSIVFGTLPYAKDGLERARAELHRKVKDGEMDGARAEAVEHVMDTYFGADNVMGAANLASQISRINHRLWPALFHGPNGRTPLHRIPDLVYLDIETLVTQMLLRCHLADTQSLIHRFIFEPAFVPLILKHFEGVPGAFSLKDNWGAYLFWGVSEKRRRVGTKLQGDQLVFDDGQGSVPWTPEGIEQALRVKKIFPGMLLCYLMVSLYYGFKCLGGFCQVNDLHDTKKRWQALLRELGETAEADALEPIQTKEMNAGGMFLSYFMTPKCDLVPATGIDMIIDPSLDTSFDRYLDLSKRITLTESMDPVLPSAYSVFYNSFERDPRLLLLSPEEIMEKTGLKNKFIL